MSPYLLPLTIASLKQVLPGLMGAHHWLLEGGVLRAQLRSGLRNESIFSEQLTFLPPSLSGDCRPQLLLLIWVRSIPGLWTRL